MAKDRNELDIASHWNAEDAGCGALIIGLKREIEKIGKGELLNVVARDPAASFDLTVWCGMTGHTLVAANHPTYVLKRKNF